MQISFPSALVGASVAVLAFLAVSAQTFVATPINPPMVIAGIPTPGQMMRVVEGQPFTVPAHKLFVCTGVAASTALYGTSGGLVSTVEIHFDGVPVLAGNIHTVNNSGTRHAGPTTLPSIPPGLVASEGTIVSADLDNDDLGALGVILGYLADA